MSPEQSIKNSCCETNIWLGTRDAVALLEDITAKGPLRLKNVIVLGDPFLFTKDNMDQFNF